MFVMTYYACFDVSTFFCFKLKIIIVDNENETEYVAALLEELLNS